MVHDDSDALFVSIFVEGSDIEVGVGRDEIEHKVLLLAIPVFPTFIPTLDEDGIEAVLRSEVDVTAHVLVVGAMLTVGLGVGIVGDTQLYGWIVVSV